MDADCRYRRLDEMGFAREVAIVLFFMADGQVF